MSPPLPSSTASGDASARLPDKPVTALPYENTIWSALGRLRIAARIAGLQMSLAEPWENGDRVPLGEADESAVLTLVSIITAPGSSLSADNETKDQAPIGIADAGRRLRQAALAGGLDLTPGQPCDGLLGPQLPLGETDLATATRLAELLEAGTFDLIAMAEELRSVLAKHGIQAEHIKAEAGNVCIGEITVDDGSTLSLLLDGRKRKYAHLLDPDHQPMVDILVGHLHDAVHDVTGGRLVNALYLPSCHWRGGEPAIRLGSLEPRFVRALIAHLQNRPQSESATRRICGARTRLPSHLVAQVLALDGAGTCTEGEVEDYPRCTMEDHAVGDHYAMVCDFDGDTAAWAHWIRGQSPDRIIALPDCPVTSSADREPCQEFAEHPGGHSYSLFDPWAPRAQPEPR